MTSSPGPIASGWYIAHPGPPVVASPVDTAPVVKSEVVSATVGSTAVESTAVEVLDVTTGRGYARSGNGPALEEPEHAARAL